MQATVGTFKCINIRRGSLSAHPWSNICQVHTTGAKDSRCYNDNDNDRLHSKQCYLAADGCVPISGMTVIDEYSMRNLLSNVANLTDNDTGMILNNNDDVDDDDDDDDDNVNAQTTKQLILNTTPLKCMQTFRLLLTNIGELFGFHFVKVKAKAKANVDVYSAWS